MEIIFTLIWLFFTFLFFAIAAIAIGVTIYFVIQSANSSSNSNLSNKNLNDLKNIKVTQGVILFMEYNPMQFILSVIKPKAKINSKAYDMEWGVNEIDLDAGDYNLKAFFPYLGIEQCCEGSIDFTLNENEVKKIKYTVPFVIFQKANVQFVEE